MMLQISILDSSAQIKIYNTRISLHNHNLTVCYHYSNVIPPKPTIISNPKPSKPPIHEQKRKNKLTNHPIATFPCFQSHQQTQNCNESLLRQPTTSSLPQVPNFFSYNHTRSSFHKKTALNFKNRATNFVRLATTSQHRRGARANRFFG